MREKMGQPITQAHLLALDTIDRLQDREDKLRAENGRLMRALCGIQYASMSQPIPIRCSFPVGHESDHAGYDANGKVFVFPSAPSVLPAIPANAPIPDMLRNCS